MSPFTTAIISLLFLFPSIDHPLNNIFNEKSLPPGVALIEDNYYVDRNEVSNIDYREYQYWVSRVFGMASEEYRATLLDASVLEIEFKLSKDYYSNPRYSEYPVVGVSWEQALAYSKWRTDRVCEMILIEHDIIDRHPENTAKNYFTYQKYLNGEYHDYEPVEELEVAIYSLPTKREWEEIIYPTFAAKTKKKTSYHTKKSKIAKGPRERGYKKLKKKSVYNLLGNVSEMVAEKGISKGGSWQHSLEECSMHNEIKYSAPANWLGFRNACKTVVLKKRIK